MCGNIMYRTLNTQKERRKSFKSLASKNNIFNVWQHQYYQENRSDKKNIIRKVWHSMLPPPFPPSMLPRHRYFRLILFSSDSFHHWFFQFSRYATIMPPNSLSTWIPKCYTNFDQINHPHSIQAMYTRAHTTNDGK